MINTNKLFTVLLIAAFIVLLSNILFTFWSMSSTLNAPLSSGDYSLNQQLNYNTNNDRYLQISYYPSVGFINPYSFMNIWIYHAYFYWFFLSSTPFFIGDWVGNTYFFIILFNFTGVLFFSSKILKYLSPHDWQIKWLITSFILITGGFLHYGFSLGFPNNAAMPLIVAACYFLISHQKYSFYLSAILLCLHQDDLSTIVVTSSIYLFVFEPAYRKYAYFPFFFACAYILFWVLVLQPMTRIDLIKEATASSMWTYRFFEYIQVFTHKLQNLGFSDFYIFFKTSVSEMSNVYFCIYGAILLRFWKTNYQSNYRKFIYFIILSPLAYWGVEVLGGGFGSRYCVGIVTAFYISWLFYLSRAVIPTYLSYRVSFFWVFPLFLTIPLHLLLTEAIPHPLDSIGKENLTRDFILDQSQEFFGLKIMNIDDKYKKVMKSNKSVIAITDSLPKNKSLCYWTNFSYEAFLMSRSDIWAFPKNYDKTDFIIIQKDAQETNFHAEKIADLNYKIDSIWNGYYQGIIPNGYTHNMVVPIKHLLVDSLQTHRIAQETEHLLLLERKDHHVFPMPASTVGFGWLKIF